MITLGIGWTLDMIGTERFATWDRYRKVLLPGIGEPPGRKKVRVEGIVRRTTRRRVEGARPDIAITAW